MAEVGPDNPKPRRRWLQFRLRTLLLVTAVLCVPLAWVGVRMNQKRQERAVIAEIEQLGGSVWLDWQVSFGLSSRPRGHPAGPFWLRKLLGDDFFSDVVIVVLPPDHETFTRKDAEGARRMVGPTPFTFGRCIDDDGLESVAALSSITHLTLDVLDIGDNGVAHLRRLTNLRWLSLNLTNITDDGLLSLRGMTTLRELFVKHTKVTDKGVARLKNALPHCTIER